MPPGTRHRGGRLRPVVPGEALIRRLNWSLRRRGARAKPAPKHGFDRRRQLLEPPRQHHRARAPAPASYLLVILVPLCMAAALLAATAAPRLAAVPGIALALLAAGAPFVFIERTLRDGSANDA